MPRLHRCGNDVRLNSALLFLVSTRSARVSAPTRSSAPSDVGRSLRDLIAPPTWYIHALASFQEDDEGGVSTMREAFERALSCVGVHPILGGAVWRALLRFEKEELEDAEETGASDAAVSSAQDR